MKDKSRFLSSVIVSLLAGFIYLIAGENLPVNIQSSVRAILSSNAPDLYLTTECFPFYEISKKSAPKISKNNSKFYINDDESEDMQYSGLISGDQATFVRPLPDKNIDFASELNKLINVGKEDCDRTDIDKIVSSEGNNILSCNEFQIADAERNFKREERINKHSIESILEYDEGNGFKLNYISGNSSEKSENCEIEILNSHFDESITDIQILVSENCNKNISRNRNSNINFNIYRNSNVNQDCKNNKISKVNKILIKIPEVNVITHSDEYNEEQVECESFNDEAYEDYDNSSEDTDYNSLDTDPM